MCPFISSFRHLVFYTDTQAALLCQAKTWYLDGTFKVLSLPFTQLFTMNAFITKGRTSKQVPLTVRLTL